MDQPNAAPAEGARDSLIRKGWEMFAGRNSFSRDQVIVAERRAWVEANGQPYYFDGISFWTGTGAHLRSVQSADTPTVGWRHAPDCNCTLCRMALTLVTLCSSLTATV